jgi:hypothetical protein
MWGHTEGTPESARKMMWAEFGQPCEPEQGNIFRQMLFYEVLHELLFSCWQATPKRCRAESPSLLEDAPFHRYAVRSLQILRVKVEPSE